MRGKGMRKKRNEGEMEEGGRNYEGKEIGGKGMRREMKKGGKRNEGEI